MSSDDTDDQFCLKEGTPHERHCIHDQGHWMCEGEAGVVDDMVLVPKPLVELAAAQLEALGGFVTPHRLRALIQNRDAS